MILKALCSIIEKMIECAKLENLTLEYVGSINANVLQISEGKDLEKKILT